MLDRAAPVLRIGASPPIGEPLPPGARRQLLSDRLCAGTTGADEVPPWSALLLLVLDRAAPMLRIGASPPPWRTTAARRPRSAPNARLRAGPAGVDEVPSWPSPVLLVLGRGAPPMFLDGACRPGRCCADQGQPAPWRAAAPCARAWRISCAPESPARMRCSSSRLPTLLILGRAEPPLPNGACGLAGAVSRVQTSLQSGQLCSHRKSNPSPE